MKKGVCRSALPAGDGGAGWGGGGGGGGGGSDTLPCSLLTATVTSPRFTLNSKPGRLHVVIQVSINAPRVTSGSVHDGDESLPG